MSTVHPLVEALEAHKLRLGLPAADTYKRIQLTGSAWSRGTGYGDKAVALSTEAAALFQRHLGRPAEDCRVCCAGCGDGLELEVFRKIGFQVEGFDLDPEKVRVAQYCGLTVKLGDLQDPPFSAGIYDAVKATHVLEHALDAPKAAAALLALLKPGGLLFLQAPLEATAPLANPTHISHLTDEAAVLAMCPGCEVLLRRCEPDPFCGRGEPHTELTLLLRRTA